MKFKFSYSCSYNLWATAALGISPWRLPLLGSQPLAILLGLYTFPHSHLLSFPFITLDSYQIFCRYFPQNKKFFILNKLSSCHFYTNLIMPLKLYFHYQSLQNKLFYSIKDCVFSLRNSAIYFELAMEYCEAGCTCFSEYFQITKLYANQPRAQGELTGTITHDTGLTPTRNQGFYWPHIILLLKFWTKSIHVLSLNLCPVGGGYLSL